MVRADANGLGALFPESVLPKRKQVVRHGSPRYRTGPLLVLLSDSPLGVIRVVPRTYSSLNRINGSGIFYFKRSYTIMRQIVISDATLKQTSEDMRLTFKEKIELSKNT